MTKKKLVDVKRLGDVAINVSDWKKQLKDFIAKDERKHILLFTMIELSNREEAEMLEHFLLQQFDIIKEEMFLSNFYTKKDLTDVNFFLQYTKLHIQLMGVEDVDVSRGLSDNFLNMFRV